MDVSPELVEQLKNVRMQYRQSRESIARIAEVSSITILRIEDGTTKTIRQRTYEKIKAAIDSFQR